MNEKCKDLKDWSTTHYKGQGYLRLPTGCLMCDDITKCLDEYRPPRPEVEKPEGCPAFDDYGNPILITMTGGKKP